MRVTDTSMKKRAPRSLLKNLDPNSKTILDQEKQTSVLDNSTSLIGFAKDNIPVNGDYIAFREIPASEEYLDKLGRECFEEIRANKDILKIREYFRSKGIDYHTVWNFKERSKSFKRWYEMALDELGDRREKAAFWKKADSALTIKSMALYDPDWKAMEESRAKLAQDASGETTSGPRKLEIHMHSATGFREIIENEKEEK